MLRSRFARHGLIAAALVAVLAVSAGAASASHKGEKKGTLKSILFVNPLPKYPQWAIIANCLAKRAKQLGIPETETGPSARSTRRR